MAGWGRGAPGEGEMTAGSHLREFLLARVGLGPPPRGALTSPPAPRQKLDLERETIELVHTEPTDVAQLPSRVPRDAARYHFFLYKHTHEGDPLESVGEWPQQGSRAGPQLGGPPAGAMGRQESQAHCGSPPCSLQCSSTRCPATSAASRSACSTPAARAASSIPWSRTSSWRSPRRWVPIP